MWTEGSINMGSIRETYAHVRTAARRRTKTLDLAAPSELKEMPNMTEVSRMQVRQNACAYANRCTRLALGSQTTPLVVRIPGKHPGAVGVGHSGKAPNLRKEWFIQLARTTHTHREGSERLLRAGFRAFEAEDALGAVFATPRVIQHVDVHGTHAATPSALDALVVVTRHSQQ